MRFYKLRNSCNKEYISTQPGTLGGNKAEKIYGQLNCPNALRWVAKGKYTKNRVFFDHEITAILAGYRPCAICMPKKYKEWKNSKH